MWIILIVDASYIERNMDQIESKTYLPMAILGVQRNQLN